MRTFVHAGLAAGALLLGAPAFARQPAADEAALRPKDSRVTVYDAAFFAHYAPRTALDMIERVPGFTLDLGNSAASSGVDIRGFAGTAGNVVVGGARPSTKSETIDALLSRIPAERVIRVEVGPGDLYGADYAGKPQVANIILKEARGIAGNASISASHHYTGRVTPNATGSISFSKGSSTFNIAGDTARQDTTEEGLDEVTDPASGELLELRRKTNFTYDNSPFIAASWSLDRGARNSANLNARYHYDQFILRQVNHVVPSGQEERDDRLLEKHPTKTFELSGDVTRPLAGGAIKLIGLVSRQRRHTLDEYDVGNIGATQLVGGNQQLSDSRRNETLARLTWTRSDLAGIQFETGGELAWNTLDSTLDLFVFNATGEKERIQLPIDNARVTELRGELWINGSHALSRTALISLGLNYEISHLQVSGDAIADRKLGFLKPSVTLDWTPRPGWHVQAILRRTVAQLDFFDFISSADFSSGQISGGNADLEPQRTWEGRLSLQHKLLGEGQARLELGYNSVSLLQDRILTPEGFDAPGNIGTGRQAFADLTFDSPLDTVLKGLRLKLHGNIQRTRVKDPISGQLRNFSGFFPDWAWDADLRRDSGKWAYGISFSDSARRSDFGTDVIDIKYNRGAYGTTFVEFRPTPKQTLTLSIDNITNITASRELLFFDPNRRDVNSTQLDHRDRKSHFVLGLAYRQAFGSGSHAVGK